MADANDKGRGPGGNRYGRSNRKKPEGRLSDAEKQRRYRQRLKMKIVAETTKPPEDWVPAFPGQRPPFGPGNTAAVTHGADYRARHLWEDEGRAIAERVLEVNEHLRDERFLDQVVAYGCVEARLRRVRTWLGTQDIEDARTEVTLWDETEDRSSPQVTRRHTRARKVIAAESLANDLERLALAMRKELGITPASWARLRALLKPEGPDLALMWSAEDEETG